MTESFAPPEVTTGIVLEVIASCCSEYMRLAEAAATMEEREAMWQRIRTLRRSRLSFDPHSAVEVDAALAAASREFEEVTRLAAALDV